MTRETITVDLGEFVASERDARRLRRVIDFVCANYDSWSDRKAIKHLAITRQQAGELNDLLRRVGVIGPDRPGGHGSEVYYSDAQLDYVDFVAPSADVVEDDVPRSESLTTDYPGSERAVRRLSAVDPDDPAKIMNLDRYCEVYGLDRSDVRSGKLVTHTGVPYWNLVFGQDQGPDVALISEALLEDLRGHAPKYPEVVRRRQTAPHALLISLGDLHVGKLADACETREDYNLDIAAERIREGVRGLLDKASGFQIDQVILVDGGDILHVDGPSNRTTGGTPQDTAAMWHRSFVTAKRLIVEAIETLTVVADVSYVYVPGNHDTALGFALAQVAEAHFNQNRQVTFLVSPETRKYARYGNSMIAVTHGEKIKLANLALAVATECDFYSECEFRYIVGHHVHHQNLKEMPGVTYTTLRSASSADAWHARSGYIAQPAMEAMVFSPNQGQVARLTHNF